MSECRSCDAEVEWAYTEKDKRMPLDMDERPDGNLVVVSQRASEYGMTPVVRYVPKGKGNRVSHFATCPNSLAHRKKKPG